MWGALLAASIAGWLHQLTASTRPAARLFGHGVRGDPAIPATNTPGTRPPQAPLGPSTQPRPKPAPKRSFTRGGDQTHQLLAESGQSMGKQARLRVYEVWEGHPCFGRREAWRHARLGASTVLIFGRATGEAAIGSDFAGLRFGTSDWRTGRAERAARHRDGEGEHASVSAE